MAISKNPRSTNARPELLEARPDLAEFLHYLDALNAESARGAVLIAGTFIEKLLHEAIDAFLIGGKSKKKLLEESNAPIGDFYSKILLSQALGLISDLEAAECTIVRKIRNRFAHDIRVNFTDDSIINLCKNMKMSPIPNFVGSDSAFLIFSTATHTLAVRLLNRAKRVSEVSLVRPC
ncbi:hypothetical protein [Alteraurantiacibacter palmitatis]|uniref:DUF4145 domain-containing protein n=1 Tax=Alteraurantiacibacter palmitatis TaxID=2054628 RepID=A0ABV7E909_9SPHN